MRLTKIVCTLGPASEDLDVLEKMVRSGMDVARLNFSHGTHDEHFTMLTRLRTVARSVGRTVAAIQDLCGPKIRLSETEGEGAAFERGSTVRFYREAVKANSKQFSCTFPSLIADLRLGDRILIRDGRIQLVVVATEPDRVSCHVVQGGQFHSGAGINLPGVKLSTSALTEKDRHDLQWGIENEVDYVALSFVRSPHDVLQLRRILHEHTSDIQVIAKLEKPEAVEHLADIIEVSDAVMVARGDLGVEMSLEKVPGIQKRIIAEAARQEKPVITATEMLQSMIHSPTPTRAEVTDVANAILDGSDAVMLSGETAVGEYPLEVIGTMSRIAEEADALRTELHPVRPRPRDVSVQLTTAAVAHGAWEIARRISTKVVAVGTHSGETARVVSKQDLDIPILGASDDERACRRMALYRGVIPVHVTGLVSLDQMMKELEGRAIEHKLVSAGDLMVILGGVPFGRSGTTNTIQVRRLHAPEREGADVSSRARWRFKSKGKTYDYAVDYLACIGCGLCVKRCPYNVYGLAADHAVINEAHLSRCILDRTCERSCPTGAISIREVPDAPAEDPEQSQETS